MTNTLSIAIRQALLDYKLKPLERDLAHILVLESYDLGVNAGAVQLDKWAIRLGMTDSGRARGDRTLALLKSLQDLRIVDLDPVRGTFELRPYARDWSRARALRTPIGDQKEQQGHTAPLPLHAERPLSEALSDLSREKTLASGPAPAQPPRADWPALPPDYLVRFKRALQSGTVEQEFPECFAAPVGGNSPGGGSTAAAPAADIQPAAKTLEKTAPAVNASVSLPPIASSALRNSKAKLATASEDKSEKSRAAWHWLQTIDNRRHLAGGFGPMWKDLCESNPDYVLNRLRGAYEFHVSRVRKNDPDVSPIGDPLAWLSRKCRDEKMFTK